MDEQEDIAFDEKLFVKVILCVAIIAVIVYLISYINDIRTAAISYKALYEACNSSNIFLFN